jgi:hypothetical protein
MKNVIISIALILSLCGAAFAGDIYHPVAHWTFDEGSGTVAYDSAGSSDGTISGATWEAGKIGGALRFDGIDDYVNCGHAAALGGMQEVTVSAWINADVWNTVGTGARVISKRYDCPGSSYDISVYSNPDRTADITFYGQTNITTTASSTPAFAVNQWYLITATDTGSVQKLYVNGTNVATTNTYTGPINNNTTDVWIGTISNNYLSSTTFDGLIDDVRIYDYALSANEVTQLYNIPEPATICLFAFAGLMLRRKK